MLVLIIDIQIVVFDNHQQQVKDVQSILTEKYLLIQKEKDRTYCTITLFNGKPLLTNKMRLNHRF